MALLSHHPQAVSISLLKISHYVLNGGMLFFSPIFSASACTEMLTFQHFFSSYLLFANQYLIFFLFNKILGIMVKIYLTVFSTEKHI